MHVTFHRMDMGRKGFDVNYNDICECNSCSWVLLELTECSSSFANVTPVFRGRQMDPGFLQLSVVITLPT